MKVLNYTGLQNLWTNIKNYITTHTPTKTSDLTNDSDFVVSSSLATVATSGDYNDLDNLPTIPSKTSDLSNDSDFVDTSNSAVASGITSAKVTDYDTHIADTDIHVTTADKTKWNNGVSQSYVFRYSSTALVASSTNSNSLLDNTDNLKVGDKVIDSNGVLFSITAIDTANSTFTIGTALVDLAQDSDVVHKSGDETIDGNKTFSKYITFDGSSTGDEYSPNARTNLWLMSNRDTEDVSGVLFDTYRQNTAQGTGSHILGIGIKENSIRYETCRFAWGWDNNLNGYSFSIEPTLQGTNQAVRHNLGTSTKKWSEVHATTYYYGSSDTEFSDKFVTTDTAQTISDEKQFTSTLKVNRLIWFNNPSVVKGTLPSTDITPYRMYFGNGLGYENSLFNIDTQVRASGVQRFTFRCAENVVGGNDTRFIIVYNPTDANPRYFYFMGDAKPYSNNTYGLGDSRLKWATINGLNPSSLGMPDLSNGIDISSYITLPNTHNTYTPSVNGWISIILKSTAGALGLYIYQGDLSSSQYSSTSLPNETEPCAMCCLPVVGNIAVSIDTKGSNAYVVSAKFFPCQGNV